MHRGNRHGRSEAAREAVLQAADDLVAETGYAKVTIEGIAARAGVAKQTIYRWWRSKTDILVDAFVADSAQELTLPDTGALRTDLRAHLDELVRFLEVSDSGAVFRALAGQAQHDPELAARLRAEVLPRLRARDRVPFDRAVARGELPAEVDVDLLVDQTVGPIHFRVLVTGEPVTPALLDALVTRADQGR
ncbi:TetR/AcrR family transcriptional regulator [Micromonospora rifamycinica]|uniref:Transcriptional regulator, TetR family n=1 Tax=Micromonospora rifamycinica TaxID=291594 RepID=A0A120F9J6_9ACTN|nr:TetR/AcrR family transcriptional regulator [Micromonospora rifamycinica]KWV33472.1 TetR family transcriptional regulator [Micromonospora rifamycinica]SCG74915.1 transcriptional regulator, TetR family [Micromonospora rifamycinica]